MPKRKSKDRRKSVDQGFVKALAHGLRVEILNILTERMASPKELARMLDEGLSQVSYHVKVLEDYERIELMKTEPRRGAVEHYYRATSKTLLPAKTWRGLRKGLRAVVGSGLASDLFNDLADAVTARKLTDSDSHINRMSLVLDVEGWENVEGSAERFVEEVEDEQRASATRVAKANGSATAVKSYTVGLLAFKDSRDLYDETQPKVAKSVSRKGKAPTNKGKNKRRGAAPSSRARAK